MTNNPKSGKHETRLPPPQLCQPIVTGRMKSIMVLKRIFDKNIVRSKITTVEQNCQNVPQAQFLSQTDRFHKYGIRYYILIFCVIFYALLGGIIFHATEHHDEIRHLEENVERLNLLIRGFTGHFVNITNGTLTRRRQNHVDNLIR
uniref:Uncharacterized protein n=1 Tax=Setaria digitata TaxID=48799 RepID=A0A915Q6R7_9BILA